MTLPSTASIAQNPPVRQSRRRPKQLPESNLGMQHQSIDPVLETSADEWQSERNA